MTPFAENISFFSENSGSIGKNSSGLFEFLINYFQSHVAYSIANRPNIMPFDIVPKNDIELDKRVLREKIKGKLPFDSEHLPKRRMQKFRIGGFGAITGKRCCIDPALMHFYIVAPARRKYP